MCLLNFPKNEITYIQYSSTAVQGLIKLNLSHNRLTDVTWDIFTQNTKGQDISQAYRPENIFLNGNPLSCTRQISGKKSY